MAQETDYLDDAQGQHLRKTAVIARAEPERYGTPSGLTDVLIAGTAQATMVSWFPTIFLSFVGYRGYGPLTGTTTPRRGG